MSVIDVKHDATVFYIFQEHSPVTLIELMGNWAKRVQKIFLYFLYICLQFIIILLPKPVLSCSPVEVTVHQCSPLSFTFI